MRLSWQWFFMVLLHTSLGSESPDECHPESPDECRPDSVSMLQLHRRPYMAQMQLDSELTKDSDASITASSMTDASYFWSTKNGNVQRTGSSSVLAPITLLSSPPNFSFYETKGNRIVRAAPMIDGDKNIYLSTVPGRIYKFNPSGKVLWMHEEPEKEMGEKRKIPGFVAVDPWPDWGLACVPALMDGNLFSANQGGEVFALNMSDGTEVWRTRLPHGNANDGWSMTAVDGVVISAASTLQPPFHDPNNMLFALNATSGKVLWQFTSDNNMPIYNILVACANGSAVFADDTGNVYKLSLSDGKLLWKVQSQFPVSFSTGGAVLGPNGVVYVTSNDGLLEANGVDPDPFTQGVLRAIDFTTGQELWYTKLKYPANNAAAVGFVHGSNNLSIILGIGTNPDPADWALKHFPGREKKNAVVAVDAQTGKLRWLFELPVYFGAAKGDVPKAPADGAHDCLPDAFANAVISGDGSVFIGNQNGKFYGIKDINGDGTISQSSGEAIGYDVHAAFQGSAGIAPGMVVATPCDGMHVWHKP